MSEKKIVASVFRYDPSRDDHPRYEAYEIPYQSGMKVLDALRYIKDRLGVNLAFRSSCRMGICGSCGVMVNKSPCCACREDVADQMVIEPLPHFPVVRDLVINLDKIHEKILRIRPFLETTKPLQSFGDLAKLDVQELREYGDLSQCIECFSCIGACPVVDEVWSSQYSGPTSMVLLARLALNPRDEGDRSRVAYFEGVYDCTTCRRCVEVCPMEIDIPGKAIERLRAYAVRSGLGPLKGHMPFIDNIRKTGRSVDKQSTPLLEIAPDVVEVEDPVDEVAFFTGCLMDYRLQQGGLNIVEVLKRNKVRVHIPKGQSSCASPAWRCGDVDLGIEQARKNVELFEDLGVKKVIAGCAGCTVTMKHDWTRAAKDIRGREPDFRVYDFAEYIINELGIDDFDTDSLGELKMKVTYHSPCHLGRGQGIIEEPLQLINLVPGVRYEEMEDFDRCCGAGGGVRSGRRSISMALGRRKADCIIDSGAEACITECPFCLIQIRDVLRQSESDVETLNIPDLLARSYSAGQDC